MENAPFLKALLIADGSGGHMIPALQVARALAAQGARVTCWYAQRGPMAPFLDTLAADARGAGVEIEPLPVATGLTLFQQLKRWGQLWRQAHRCVDTLRPDVVVGFGGWVSTPVVLAAKARGLPCLLHEQNVVPGRANRLLSRWVDRIAVSFRETQGTFSRAAVTVLTGMPVRRAIGDCPRTDTAARFGFLPDRPTLVILGGSQGSHAINHLMARTATLFTAQERQAWQVLHVTGPADAPRIHGAYAAAGLRAWVAPFLADMEAAFAQADLVIARAGASTIAELARRGIPAILIPYPHGGAHQRANARVAEAVGGAVVLEEREVTAPRLLEHVRRLLGDPRVRAVMGSQMRRLDMPDATERLARAIVETAHRRAEPRVAGLRDVASTAPEPSAVERLAETSARE